MSIKFKLSNNLIIVKTEDGTTRGKFDKLLNKDFSSREIASSYGLKLAFASYEIGKCLAEEDNAEEASRHRNLAMDFLNEAISLLASEMRLEGLDDETNEILKNKPLKKSTLRKWIASGAFARIKTDYASASRTLSMKNTPALQRLLECYVGDIMNKRVSLLVVQCEKVEEKVAKAEKAKTEAEAKAAEAKAAEAKAEEK